jgi:hypothetical protein
MIAKTIKVGIVSLFLLIPLCWLLVTANNFFEALTVIFNGRSPNKYPCPAGERLQPLGNVILSESVFWAVTVRNIEIDREKRKAIFFIKKIKNLNVKVPFFRMVCLWIYKFENL